MNRKIIVAVVVITGAGVMNSWLNNKPLTPVIIGSYVFIFVLSIMDMFGGEFSTLAGALAMLAVTMVLLVEIPWQGIIQLAQGGSIMTGKSPYLPPGKPKTGDPCLCPGGSIGQILADGTCQCK